MNDERYELYAIKYAERDAFARDHYIFTDVHDAPMPMDYFLWVIRSASRTIVVDVGFDEDEARKRKRRHLRCPAQSLSLLDIDAETVTDVIVTHLHYDHVGNLAKFPNARFHLQDTEMAYATGRSMRHQVARGAYTVDHVVDVVRAVYADRVQFHDGDGEPFPGVHLHLIGGHTRGLQVVRVATQRGWVVLASDASHFHGNFVQRSPFVIADDVGRMLEGFERLATLADSDEHVIPGHDPLVIQCYPPLSDDTKGIVCRLDAPPSVPMTPLAQAQAKNTSK